MLGPTLVSIHNIRHFHCLLLDIRRAIREDGWSSLGRAWPVAAAALSAGGDAGGEKGGESPDSVQESMPPGTTLA